MLNNPVTPKTPCFFPLLALLAGGCSTTSASNPTSLAKLADNTAYVGPDGTVLVKGFAGRFTKNFVCILPSGSYRITVDSKKSGGGGLNYQGIGAEGKGSSEVDQETTIIYKPQYYMIAVQQILGNACVLLGNGLFGETCQKKENQKNPKNNDKDNECSGPAPDKTLENYNRFVDKYFSALAASISPLEKDARTEEGKDTPPQNEVVQEPPATPIPAAEAPNPLRVSKPKK